MPFKKSKEPYQCWKCGVKFWRYAEFLHHVRTLHGGKPVKRMSYETEIPIEPKDKAK